jgi:DNA repair exonuclease SbcCD ATPase subunit
MQVKAIESAMASLHDQLQHPGCAGELMHRLKRIEREYRRVRSAVEALPTQPQWPDAEHVSDLESEILRQKQENQFLRDQVSQLQSEMGNYQTADVERARQIERLVAKLRRVQDERADAARICQRQQTQIADLQGLYRDAAGQAEQLTEGQKELQRQLKKSRKDARAAAEKGDDLQVMLERAREDLARQMDDNQLLLKHARRPDVGVDGAEEIARLKAELKSAFQLIERLRNEIEQFRRQKQAAVTRHRVGQAAPREEDPGSDDSSILKPAMDALDDAIRQLEVTLHPPRKKLALSSSSG